MLCGRFAAAHRLPAIYEFDSPVRDGGLMSYGPDLDESFDRVGALVDRILKGAKPAELPFEQPTLFHFAPPRGGAWRSRGRRCRNSSPRRARATSPRGAVMRAELAAAGILLTKDGVVLSGAGMRTPPGAQGFHLPPHTCSALTGGASFIRSRSGRCGLWGRRQSAPLRGRHVRSPPSPDARS
jgi:hypothetical protein